MDHRSGRASIWALALALAASLQAQSNPGRPADGQTDRKSNAVVIKQDGDTVTILVADDTKTRTRTLALRATSLTRLTGMDPGWMTTKWPHGISGIRFYDLERKTGEFTFRGNILLAAAMQTACVEDRCPVNACKKKCGAKPCTC